MWLMLKNSLVLVFKVELETENIITLEERYHLLKNKYTNNEL